MNGDILGELFIILLVIVVLFVICRYFNIGWP